MKKTLALIIVFFLIAAGGCSDLNTNAYLEENYSALDMDNPDLSLMAKDLENIDVVLAGEQHYIRANYASEFGLMTALHQQAGFRYLLAEMGPSLAGLINLYLQTGDKWALDSLSLFPEENQFYERLYNYNLQHPEDQRIILVGVDIEDDLSYSFAYMTTLAGAEQLPLLKNADYLVSEEIPGYIQALTEDVAKNPDLYAETLGSDYVFLEILLKSMDGCLAYSEDPEQGKFLREQIMYENFLKLFNHYPQGKYFGQFGMEHVFQSQCATYLEGVERFAMQLNGQDSPVRGRVLSIPYVYFDCTWVEDGNVEEIQNLLYYTRPMREFARGDFTLFRINGEDSPYRDGAYMIPGPAGGNTTDYFQYVLAIKGSSVNSIVPYE